MGLDAVTAVFDGVFPVSEIANLDGGHVTAGLNFTAEFLDPTGADAPAAFFGKEDILDGKKHGYAHW
jgi:hypothetical protein